MVNSLNTINIFDFNLALIDSTDESFFSDYISETDDVYTLLSYSHLSNCLDVFQIHNYLTTQYKGLTNELVKKFDKLFSLKSLKFSSINEQRTRNYLDDLLVNLEVGVNVTQFSLLSEDRVFNSPFINCFYKYGFRRLEVTKYENSTYSLIGFK